MLIGLGVQEQVTGGAGAYLVSIGQVLPGQPMFNRLPAPGFLEGIEQLAGGTISIVLGLGSLQLVKMRKTSRLDDKARERSDGLEAS
jgi:hypothetical protein